MFSQGGRILSDVFGGNIWRKREQEKYKKNVVEKITKKTEDRKRKVKRVKFGGKVQTVRKTMSKFTVKAKVKQQIPISEINVS
jgi:hypothetical protein